MRAVGEISGQRVGLQEEVEEEWSLAGAVSTLSLIVNRAASTRTPASLCSLHRVWPAAAAAANKNKRTSHRAKSFHST